MVFETIRSLLAEQEFAIDWSENDLNALSTVADVVMFVENQV